MSLFLSRFSHHYNITHLDEDLARTQQHRNKIAKTKERNLRRTLQDNNPLALTNQNLNSNPRERQSAHTSHVSTDFLLISLTDDDLLLTEFRQ